jgi:hypothetical protein
MSAQYARVLDCPRCRAHTEIRTDGNGHLVEIKKPCSCAAFVVAKPDAKIMTSTCADCGKACHTNAKRCTACANAMPSRRVDAPYPKCKDCNKQLAHHLAQRCDDCKKVHNRKRSDRAAALARAQKAA